MFRMSLRWIVASSPKSGVWTIWLEDSDTPSSRSFEVLTWMSSTSTTTSDFDLSMPSISFWAMRTLSTVSRMVTALSCSFCETLRAPIRLRSSWTTSLTSALDRKKVWMTRSS